MKKSYNFIIFLCVSINMSSFAMDTIKGNTATKEFIANSYWYQKAKLAAEDKNLPELARTLDAWQPLVLGKATEEVNSFHAIFFQYLSVYTHLRTVKPLIDQHEKFKLESKETLPLTRRRLAEAKRVLEKWSEVFDNTPTHLINPNGLESYWQDYITYATEVTDFDTAD